MWTNVPLSSTLQQNQNPHHTNMNDKCIWSFTQLYNIECVSGEETEQQHFPCNTAIYAKITGTHLCKTNTAIYLFIFLQEIHEMNMPAHTLPQNGCYFASVAKNLFEFCIHCANWQPHYNKDQLYSWVQVIIQFSLNIMSSDWVFIHTVIIIILQHRTAIRSSTEPVKSSS